MSECCKTPCDGSPCHWECVVSESADCVCHCRGEFHGWGSFSNSNAQTMRALREREKPSGGARPRVAAKLAEVREARKATRTAKEIRAELRKLSHEESLAWAEANLVAHPSTIGPPRGGEEAQAARKAAEREYRVKVAAFAHDYRRRRTLHERKQLEWNERENGPYPGIVP